MAAGRDRPCRFEPFFRRPRRVTRRCLRRPQRPRRQTTTTERPRTIRRRTDSPEAGPACLLTTVILVAFTVQFLLRHPRIRAGDRWGRNTTMPMLYVSRVRRRWRRPLPPSLHKSRSTLLHNHHQLLQLQQVQQMKMTETLFRKKF